MAQELETVWENTIPSIDTIAGDDQYIVRDNSASPTQRIKKGTWTQAYNYVKGLLDTAYGAFVARWPSFSEVTAKPVLYPINKREITANTGSTEISMTDSNFFVITMESNTEFILDNVGLSTGLLHLVFIQGGSGSKVLTLDGSKTAWYNGSPGSPILQTGVGGIDLITYFIDSASERAYLVSHIRQILVP